MLKHRLGAGIPLALAVILAFVVPGWPGAVIFLVLAIFFLWTGLREFFVILERLHIDAFVPLSLGAGISLLLSPCAIAFAGTALPLRLLLADVGIFAMFFCFGGILVLRDGASAKNIARLLISFGSVLYAAWLPSFLVKLYFIDPRCINGRSFALYIIVITKIADVGAFALGTATARRPGGNHKLFPRISPKKSWEGLVGGILASVIVSICAVMFLGDALFCWSGRPFGLTAAVIWGILATLLGLLGDLFESALKRASDTKDSGRIPGLGGVLDILDSLIPVAPLFYVYVCVLAMVT